MFDSYHLSIQTAGRRKIRSDGQVKCLVHCPSQSCLKRESESAQLTEVSFNSKFCRKEVCSLSHEINNDRGFVDVSFESRVSRQVENRTHPRVIQSWLVNRLAIDYADLFSKRRRFKYFVDDCWKKKLSLQAQINRWNQPMKKYTQRVDRIQSMFRRRTGRPPSQIHLSSHHPFYIRVLHGMGIRDPWKRFEIISSGPLLISSAVYWSLVLLRSTAPRGFDDTNDQTRLTKQRNSASGL